jgi:tetratricopeptide (TPR) repeat protein
MKTRLIVLGLSLLAVSVQAARIKKSKIPPAKARSATTKPAAQAPAKTVAKPAAKAETPIENPPAPTPEPGDAKSSTKKEEKATPTGTAKKWLSTIPKFAEDAKLWRKLIEEMKDKHFKYGQLAVGNRLITFFADLETKEFAFRTIVDLIDEGYPFPTRKFFISGDIEPMAEDGFQDSYNLYKAMVNVEKKTEKWATYYFSKLNKEKSPKYLFYQAVDLYRQKKLPEAVLILHKVLENYTKDPKQVVFAKKVARTLARIYYEQGEFEKAADIYMSFLLRTNPVTPSDYMEAAWAFFRIRHYDDALGVLYNMESKAAHHLIFLEKYIIRALVYRDYCGVTTTESLINSFEKEFGAVIDGIKMGEPLRKFPILGRVEHAETAEYRQVVKSLDELSREKANVEDLDSSVRELANYLYDSEIKMLARQKGLYEDAALETLANHLVILGESLRFLKFDVAREKFNPDRVFRPESPKSKILVEDIDELQFRLHWTQMGDYWRDERLNYKGLIANICDEPEPIPGQENKSAEQKDDKGSPADVSDELDVVEDTL